MSKRHHFSDVVALLLPESQHWARSLLPGIAETVRQQSPWFLVNLADVSALVRLLGTPDQPLGVIGAFDDESLGRLAPVLAEGVPVVNVSARFTSGTVPSVTHDNLAVGAMAAEHLLDRGFRHFAYVGVDDSPLSQDRFSGFRARLEQEGDAVERIHRMDLRGGHVAGWLRGLKASTGIFATHDNCARKLCWEAERLGLEIPAQVGVIGVDNDPYYCELSRTPLSSVALDFAQVGRRAASRLLADLQGSGEQESELRVPPLRVVDRLSTDRLAVEDPLVRRARDQMKAPREGRLGVAELARSLGVSKSALEKRFKAATGQTVFSLIHHYRMERARDLLEHSRLSVAEVSDQIGLADVKRFSKLFKETYGQTPRDFRK
jgi:LacI family transcriptional regulator